MLINKEGHVKMCDFGISGYLVDSVAKTMDAGCKPYMAVSVLMCNPSSLTLRRLLLLRNWSWLTSVLRLEVCSGFPDSAVPYKDGIPLPVSPAV